MLYHPHHPPHHHPHHTQDITSRLAEALAAIHKFNLHLAEDINEDVEHLQSQLSRLKYRVCGVGASVYGWEPVCSLIIIPQYMNMNKQNI